MEVRGEGYPTCTCSSCAINCIAVLSDKGVFGGGGGVSFTRQSEVFSEYCAYSAS